MDEIYVVDGCGCMSGKQVSVVLRYGVGRGKNHTCGIKVIS